eukprot:COSAG01_NODE_991_length_12286_cov_4.629605_14_plen_72_part_00
MQAGQAYPCKELARLREPALRALVPRLMAEEPPSRPPAAALQVCVQTAVEPPWPQFTSECQRFGHPPRLGK